MFEDFEQYNLDNPHSKDPKTGDTKRHSLDADLDNDPINKAKILFSFGDELQKYCALLSFPDLFRENSPECVSQLAPIFQQSLIGASIDFHMLAASAVSSLLQEHILSPEMFVSNFLQTILSAIDSKDITHSVLWSETLLDIVDYLPPKVLQSQILPVVVSKLDTNAPVAIRVASCRILAQLIKYCDVSLLKRDLVAVVVALCQDVSCDVRAAGCDPLAALAIAVGPDILKSHLMNALVDVASDDSSTAKQAAFTATVTVCPIMPIEMLKSTGIPMLVKFVKQALVKKTENKGYESLAFTIAESFGTMCLAVDRGIAVSDKDEYFIWYRSLVSYGNPLNQTVRLSNTNINGESFDRALQLRKLAADNYLMMTKFSHVTEFHQEQLIDCYNFMISDPAPSIRSVGASIFSDVLHFFNKSGGFLKRELNTLLSDSNDEVLEALVPQLPHLVDEFVKLGIFKVTKDFSLMEFISSLQKCETTLNISYKWRTYVSFMSQMEVICRSFNSETISVSFLSILWKRLTSIRNLQCRKAVLRLIFVVLRVSKKEVVRNEIINRIINELCMSNSFYNRMLFVKCCPDMSEIFSTFFIREHFLNNILLMACDKVANVRWAFVMFLPSLKAMIPKDDKERIKELTSIIDKLRRDFDTEVKLQLSIIELQLATVDKDKMYPDDKKKYEMECILFSGKKNGASVTAPHHSNSTTTTSTARRLNTTYYQNSNPPRTNISSAPSSRSSSAQRGVASVSPPLPRRFSSTSSAAPKK